jgi:hypothetical protein
MSERTTRTPGKKAKPRLKRRDIQGAKFLAPILQLLAPLHDHRPDAKRKLHYDEYCVWLLLYFFNPILDSMRGLQQASDIPELRKQLKLPRFSLGSFSEAGSVFDPELLVPIIEELGESLENMDSNQQLLGLTKRPVAVDGTLLHALPKMVWALWRDDEHRAAKLHLHFDLLKGVPESATLTNGQASEINELRRSLQPNRLYVEDRGYFSYLLMSEILQAGSSFVVRARNNMVYETLEERPLSEADRKQGIKTDRIVRAGWNLDRNPIIQPLRLVEILVPDLGTPRRPHVDSKTKLYRTRETDHTLLLLTDQLELDVSTIALLYRCRWQIELFFRWFKKVLEADHLLSLSENGLTIVLYCALIASMLVTLWTGRKPTKRTFEMLCFYFAGWASDEDLLAHIARLKAPEKTN